MLRHRAGLITSSLRTRSNTAFSVSKLLSTASVGATARLRPSAIRFTAAGALATVEGVSPRLAAYCKAPLTTFRAVTAAAASRFAGTTVKPSNLSASGRSSSPRASITTKGAGSDPSGSPGAEGSGLSQPQRRHAGTGLEAAEAEATGTTTSAEAISETGVDSELMSDPQHRQTVEVVEVDVIEGENGEPGNSVLGTVAGTAAGAALAGGIAAVAALSAPLAAAAVAVGAVVGAVAGGAVGKEVPRGVDVDAAMEFDQPAVVQAGREAEEQEALTEAVWDDKSTPPTSSGAGVGGSGAAAEPVEQSHGRPTLGEHEIGDVSSERRK